MSIIQLTRTGVRRFNLDRTTNVLSFSRTTVVRSFSRSTSVVVINNGSGVVNQGYTHFQNSPASVWEVTHNLGYFPGGITVQDSAGEQWLPATITHVNINRLLLSYGAYSFGGKAFIS